MAAPMSAAGGVVPRTGGSRRGVCRVDDPEQQRREKHRGSEREDCVQRDEADEALAVGRVAGRRRSREPRRAMTGGRDEDRQNHDSSLARSSGIAPREEGVTFAREDP